MTELSTAAPVTLVIGPYRIEITEHAPPFARFTVREEDLGPPAPRDEPVWHIEFLRLFSEIAWLLDEVKGEAALVHNIGQTSYRVVEGLRGRLWEAAQRTRDPDALRFIEDRPGWERTAREERIR